MEPSFTFTQPAAVRVMTPDPIDRIADIAHSCYRVEPKTHAENRQFVGRLIADKHLAMLEHYSFHVLCSSFALDDLRLFNSPFIRYDNLGDHLLISYTLRTLIENVDTSVPGVRRVIATMCDPLPPEVQELIPGAISLASPYEPQAVDSAFIATLPKPVARRHLWFSYRLTTDRGVTHELVRHRLCSFAQESTRYCNYSKDRFGNRLVLIRPLDYDEPGRQAIYDRAFQLAGESYLALLQIGARAQEARAVLPNALKADLVISAYLDEWEHIFDLRLRPVAHPECRRVLRLVGSDLVSASPLFAEDIKELGIEI